MHALVPQSASIADQPLDVLTHLVAVALLAAAAGVATAFALRARGLRWDWTMLGLGAALVLHGVFVSLGNLVTLSCIAATVTALRWHRADLRTGGDLAAQAAARIGVIDAARAWMARRTAHRPPGGGWIDDRGLLVGFDDRGQAARIPFGRASGSHALVVGATGSGKTVTQAWIVVRAIEAGHGAIVVDPKGDRYLRTALVEAARSAGRHFVEWSPDGPSVYNPYGEGTDTEIADKALAAERYTEPHYLRQAQRYLGHTIRAMTAAGIAVCPRSVVAHLDPTRLEVLARGLPEEQARGVWDYLDSLTPRHVRDLGGTRDRLAVLAESDIGRWLDPEGGAGPAFDLAGAVTGRAVVLFRLEADRRPLLAQMLGAAIVQDLLASAARHQDAPVPTVVMIDEFSALQASGISRLFARMRAAGMSLVLGTQELSDLRVGRGEAVLDQVLGNVGALIAHRQVVPESAELVSGVAGSRGVWISSERTLTGPAGTAPAGSGTRRRGRERVILPDDIQRLTPGRAAVIVPAGQDQARIVCVLRASEPAGGLR
jgi:hypothetical protein